MRALRLIALAAISILSVVSDQSIGTVNPQLDPDRLTWWRSKWSPGAVQLSSNNKSVSAVTVSLYFTPSTTLASGVLEVTFPSGFGLSAVSGASGQSCWVAVSVSAGVDALATVSGVANPTAAGVYGPFALRTRSSATGQTVDINLNFASVYIVSEAGTLGSLAVSLGGAAINPAVNKSGNSLLFKFTISVSLWRYDTFVVTIDSRWTVGSGVTCASQDYAGRWNNFNGSSLTSPHSLNCVVSSKVPGAPQTVYVYGLAVDGVELAQTADNQYVALLVGAVTTPDRVLTVNTYSWTVATTRFGTSTTLETGTVVGSPAVTPDVIYSATWKPTWTLPLTSLIPGLSLYMDFAFPLANRIPAGGGISVTVTEDVNSFTWGGGNCYIVTKLAGAKCTAAASGSITVTSVPETAGGTFITVRTIAKLTTVAGGAVKATDIKTYDGVPTASNVIDAGSNLSLFTMGSGAAVVSAFTAQLLKADGTAFTPVANPAGGTGDATGYFTFRITPGDPTLITATSKVSVYCPLASAGDDFAIYLPGTVNHIGKLELTATTTVDMSVGTTVLSQVTMAASAGSLGQVEWPVPAALASIPAGSSLSAAHYASVGASSLLALPRVATNLATAYECRLEIVDTAGIKQPQRYFARVEVQPRGFKSASFSMPCLDGNAGAPGIFAVVPDLLEIKASTNAANYYLDFVLGVNQNAASSNTGIAVGNSRASAAAYPHHSSAGSVTSAFIYSDPSYTSTDPSGKTVILVTGFPTLQANNELTVYFPLPHSAPLASLSVTITSSYTLVDDPRYQFVTYSASVDLTGKPTAAASATAFATATASPGTLANGESVGAAGLAMTLKLTVAPTNTVDPWVYVLLPTGATWTSARSLRPSSGSFDSTYFFSSPTSTFKFPGVLAKATAASLIPTAADTVYTLLGLTLPLGEAPGASVKVVQGSTGNAACTAIGTVALAITAGAISQVSISPSTTKARGTEGVNISHSITFFLPHSVPSAGSIRLSISIDYKTTTCSTCRPAGLRDASTTAAVVCSVASNAVTVSSFAELLPGASITLEVSRLLPPGSVGTYNFVQSLGTYTQVTGGQLIDQYTVGSGTQVTVSASSAPGSVFWSAKKTFPAISNAQRVDLYLRFSLSHTLPKCGVITLTVPMTWRLQSGENKDSCFLSPVRYTACVLSGNNLVITVDGDTQAGTYFELFLDSAVDNPSAATSSGFQITTSWFDAVLDADGTTVQASQKFTPAALLSSVLTPSSLSIDPVTALEPATYQLNFTDSVAYAAGDQYWVVFPRDFDPFLGDVSKWFSADLATYYIDCSCSGVGQTWCTVDHGVVVLTGRASAAAGQPLSISIRDVVNPRAGTSGNLELYHVDAGGNFLSVLQTFGTVTTVAPTGKVDFRGLSATSTVVQQASTYVFRFYISDTITTDFQLRVTFPREYDLPRLSSTDAYPCSTTYRDQSSSQKLTTLQEWNQATSCPLSANTLILPAPKASFQFSTSLQISWTISEVLNPQVGTARSAASSTSDFDAWDRSLWPGVSAWTGKFALFAYRVSTKSVTLRTYDNLHAGYLGLTTSLKTLAVTSAAQGTNRIAVFSGTQSNDFYISTASAKEPCASQSLQFTPKTNKNTPDASLLKYTSSLDNFTILEGRWQARFRVAAATGMAKGLYLVDWSVTETPQPGVTGSLYGGLSSTVVEVYQSAKGQFPIAVGSIPNILIGYSSAPVKVSVTNAPHTLLNVAVTVENSPPKITITPSTLAFAPDTNELYFQIQVGSDYSQATSGSVLPLVFTLSGSDAEAYSAPTGVRFSTSPTATVPAAGSVLAWNTGTVTRTKATFAPRVDQAGVLYWHLSAAGTAVPEFEALRQAVGSVFTSQNSTVSSAPADTISANETWTDYQRRLLKAHMTSEWIGAVAVWDPTASLALVVDWLWAGVSYQVSGYLDNLNPYPVGVVAKTETFATLATAQCQPFSMKFQGSVEAAMVTKVAQVVAKYQGVNPLRLFNAKFEVSYSRRMQGIQTYSTFSYTLVTDRSLDSLDPSSQAQVTGSALTALKSDLNSTLGITSTLYSITNTAAPVATVPTWTLQPTAGEATASTLSVTLRSSSAGTTCCVAQVTSKLAPSADQVLSGFSASNQVVPSSCIATNTTQTKNTVVLSGLKQATAYFAYCAAADDYPLWGTPMAFSLSNPMLPVAMQTLAESAGTTDTSAGEWLCVAVVFWV